jgi:release factor glutamine methyltransferase
VNATDISPEALRVARTNAHRNGTASRVAFVRGNMLAPFRLRPAFHAVASNPPYIRSQDLADLQPEVRDHEPHIALDGGADGLGYYQSIVSAAADLLLPGGCLALELPEGAAHRVSALCALQPAFGESRVHRDLAGVDRVLLARKRC